MKLVSTQTELAVIKNMCGSDITVSGTLLAGVDESYFHNSFTKETLEVIKDYTKENGTLPKWRALCEDPTLSEKVRQKLKESKVDVIRTPQEAIKTLELLNKYRQLRGIFDLSEYSVSEVRKKKVDPSKVLDELADKLVSLRQTKAVENDTLVFGKGNNSTQFIKDMMSAEQLDFIPTGFKSFDDENQGFGFGNLVILAGTTGGGKSTLASQFAINWSNMGEDVTIVPLEMSKKEMSARLMANAAGLDVRKILFGKMSETEKVKYWRSFKKFVVSKKKRGGSLRVFKPQTDMAIEEILASVYPLGSKIVIIDYISLLKGVDGDDAWQKLGAVARYCKVYAETNNMIIVLLAQLSEDGLVRYARSIKEHANYMWQFIATSTTREQEIINIEQTKARNGRLFDFTLRATMSTMQVRDLDVEEKDALSDANHKKSTNKPDGGKNNKFKKDKLGKTTPDKDEESGKSSPSKSYLKDLSDDD